MRKFTFDTIDGEVEAIERYDTDYIGTFFECYLTNNHERIFIGESYSDTEKDIENDVNDLLHELY